MITSKSGMEALHWSFLWSFNGALIAPTIISFWIYSEDWGWAAQNCATSSPFSKVNCNQWWVGRSDLSLSLYSVECHRGSGLSPLLFNIYMRPLGEIIHWHRTNYLQYTDDSQLYISGTDECNDSVDVFSWCVEIVEVQMANSRLQMNLGKTQWFWILGPSGSSAIQILLLDGVALPQRDPMYNLKFLLNLLFEEQVAVMAMRTFMLCASCTHSYFAGFNS